jgi:hypothetical protein
VCKDKNLIISNPPANESSDLEPAKSETEPDSFKVIDFIVMKESGDSLKPISWIYNAQNGAIAKRDVSSLTVAQIGKAFLMHKNASNQSKEEPLLSQGLKSWSEKVPVVDGDSTNREVMKMLEKRCSSGPR